LYETQAILAQLSKRSFGQLSCLYQAPPVILNPWIGKEYYLTHTTPVTACPVPVIARLDRAIQKFGQHAFWIIRSSRMMTLKLVKDADLSKESNAKLI
jgi:hypothetical protein